MRRIEHRKKSQFHHMLLHGIETLACIQIQDAQIKVRDSIAASLAVNQTSLCITIPLLVSYLVFGEIVYKVAHCSLRGFPTSWRSLRSGATAAKFYLSVQ